MSSETLNKYKKLLIFLLIIFTISSCSKDDDEISMGEGESEENLSELSLEELSIMEYFKEISLGLEFGNAGKETQKWKNEMKIFVGGEPDTELMDELEKVKTEINGLATDGFKMNIVNDSLQSNYYIFFGSRTDYSEMFPRLSDLVENNWGLFSIYWNNQGYLTSGHMYIDITRADEIESKHLLREELTQSLGLAKDSPKFLQSIFQSSWTKTTKYTALDKDLISVLYHPKMVAGLNEEDVDEVLIDILTQ